MSESKSVNSETGSCTTTWLPICSAKCCHHVVVPHPSVVFEHHRLDLIRDHCSFDVGAGKFLDRRHGAPARDHEKLYSIRQGAFQDRRVDEALDAPKRGEGLAAKMA